MASIIRRSYKTTLPNGKTVTRKCDHYSIQYRDAAGKIKRIKGYTDKGATKQLAADLERAQARGERLMTDPYKSHKARAMAEHVTEYLESLRTVGRDDKYVDNAGKRLTILRESCGWPTLGAIEPNSFERWRAERKAGKPQEKASKSRRDNGCAATTLNQYLDTVCAFLNWCAAKGRLPGIQIGKRMVATVMNGVGKVDGPKVRIRRALTDEQVTALLCAASEDRRLVYRVALAVGLRRQELEDLKWGDVRLASIPPYLALRAEATKARRGDRLNLPQSLADALRAIKGDAKDSDPVFAVVPPIEAWKADLEAASIPYKDDMGRQADFHGGTRKTLCTRMHRAGVPVASAMLVMRHTDPRLTMVDYADAGQLNGSILPELPSTRATPDQKNATQAG